MSPSQMCLPIMESPLTRSANVFRVGLKPTDSIVTGIHSSDSCSRFRPNPAGIEPNRGISTTARRNACETSFRRSDLALPGIGNKKAFSDESLNMVFGGSFATPTELRRHFSRRGRGKASDELLADKIEDAALCFSQFTHTSHTASISREDCQPTAT